MPRKSSAAVSNSRLPLRLPNIPSTLAQKRRIFGVTQKEFDAILGTVRRFSDLYLDVNHLATHQEEQLIQVENAVKEAYPNIFSNGETKIQHLRNCIYRNHDVARSARKVTNRGGMGEVVETGTRETQVSDESGESDAEAMDEDAGPSSASGRLSQGSPVQPESEPRNTHSSSARQASLPPDSVEETVHVRPSHSAPLRRRGCPPKQSAQPTEGSGVTPFVNASASTSAGHDLLPLDSVGQAVHVHPGHSASPRKTGRPSNRATERRGLILPVNSSASASRLPNRQVEVVIQSTQLALPPTVHVPPPNTQPETPPNDGSDPGLKEVKQFLASTCKPSLIHLLDHLVHYGCVSGDFLRFLAGRAARVEEEEFHKYLRNHFSKGRARAHGQEGRDLTEIEILVLTEGLLSLRGDR